MLLFVVQKLSTVFPDSSTTHKVLYDTRHLMFTQLLQYLLVMENQLRLFWQPKQKQKKTALR